MLLLQCDWLVHLDLEGFVNWSAGGVADMAVAVAVHNHIPAGSETIERSEGQLQKGNDQTHPWSAITRLLPHPHINQRPHRLLITLVIREPIQSMPQAFLNANILFRPECMLDSVHELVVKTVCEGLSRILPQNLYEHDDIVLGIRF